MDDMDNALMSYGDLLASDVQSNQTFTHIVACNELIRLHLQRSPDLPAASDLWKYSPLTSPQRMAVALRLNNRKDGF